MKVSRRAIFCRFFPCLVVASVACGTSFATLAAEKKVLRTAFRAAEKGFDPAQRDDRYSVGILESLFEPLLTYDHLARPVKLVPLVAETIPVAQENGTRYTFKIKPGIFFVDDAAFKGKKRELVAADMEYAIKRFRDPVNRSPYEWLFENKLVGLDELAEQAKKNGKLDYDAKIEGIQVSDRYTISFKLKEPDYNFLYFLAMPITVPVAREVIEAYPEASNNHPVGTGPYFLKHWSPRFKIVLERNPNYRGFTLDETWANADDPWDQAAIQALRGKRLPLLDTIEIYPIEEEQPRFLAFMNHEHDYMDETPFTFIPKVLPAGRLAANLQAQGILVFPEAQPEITYYIFNMDNPIVGGYTPEKVALRRALGLAYNRDTERYIIRKGQVTFAEQPVGPGVTGFDADFTALENAYNPSRAKALLDTYDYVDKNGDGWRDLPDGTALSLQYKYASNEREKRDIAENWVKSMADVSIRMSAIAVQFADLVGDRKRGHFMIAENAWIADYPDAQNFLQLLYGPNIEQSNDARFKLKAYDDLYVASLRLPDGAERNKIYREMYRLMLAYAPWRLGMHRIFTHLVYPWVKGYKKHPILYTSFKYMDIDVAAQKAATK